MKVWFNDLLENAKEFFSIKWAKKESKKLIEDISNKLISANIQNVYTSN